VQSSNSETDNIVFLNKLSSTAECVRYQQCTIILVTCHHGIRTVRLHTCSGEKSLSTQLLF